MHCAVRVSSSLCLAVWCAAVVAQGPAGDEAPPQGLTVIMVDIGQGSAAVIKAPDGTVHVYDAGNDGQGTSVMVPLLRSLNPTSYGVTFASHHHSDHIGGLDEVLNQLPFQLAYDRGDTAASGSFFTAYRTAAGARRRVPTLGQVIQLGGGATARVLCHNGNVVGGAAVPVSGQNQEENARSLAIRLEYRNFSMWLGGDLTGGGVTGGSATPDVESPATLACGDVDVYICNHHGSATSSNTNLWARLAPELALVSCGTDNSFGHPHDETIALVNTISRCVPLVSTTVGARKYGYGVSKGNAVLTTDGQRYRITTPAIGSLEFFVDETTGRAPVAGDLLISEFHRDPAAVADTNGEYLEITNVSGAPVSLHGLIVRGSSGQITLGSHVIAYPGRPVLFVADGDDTRNGGLPFGITWPRSSIVLGNTSGTLQLGRGTTTFDSVPYTSSFPGGSGSASQRRDLLAAGAVANFAAGATTYGLGDRGTPGRRNSVDTTNAPGRMVVEVRPSELTLRASAISDGNLLSVMGLSFGNTGFPLFNATVPVDPDALFLTTTNLPGFVAVLPSEGYRSLTLPLPIPNPLVGAPAFAVHLALNLQVPSVGAVSQAAPFVFQ
jgi:competence protein ComEC